MAIAVDAPTPSLDTWTTTIIADALTVDRGGATNFINIFTSDYNTSDGKVAAMVTSPTLRARTARVHTCAEAVATPDLTNDHV